MYQLHIANKNYSSWSLRPWVLMKEMGIPFEEVLHPFGNIHCPKRASHHSIFLGARLSVRTFFPFLDRSFIFIISTMKENAIAK